jgi:hypothetical protein
MDLVKRSAQAQNKEASTLKEGSVKWLRSPYVQVARGVSSQPLKKMAQQKESSSHERLKPEKGALVDVVGVRSGLSGFSFPACLILLHFAHTPFQLPCSSCLSQLIGLVGCGYLLG